MERHNLDLGIPLTRAQWLQLGSAADFQADDGVLEWTPSELDVIHVSVREHDAPRGWENVSPPADEREVARFVYNDGRPMAQLTPPTQPAIPAVGPKEQHELEVELERWVRGKWHVITEAAGLNHNIGAIPEHEPRPVD
jgi:hypothetical protein